MIAWFIVGILFVCGVIIIKMNHLKHRATLVFLIFLALFLYSTISVVNSVHDLSFDNTEGFFSAVKVYLGWLGNGFQNLKSLTGNAVKMDWTSANGTLLNKTNEKK